MSCELLGVCGTAGLLSARSKTGGWLYVWQQRGEDGNCTDQTHVTLIIWTHI